MTDISLNRFDIVTVLKRNYSVSMSHMSNLIHTEGFPVIKVGSRYIIPIDALREWLIKQATSEFSLN